MATIAISVDHELSEAEALKRIKGLLEEVKKEHGSFVRDLKESWEGNTGTFSFSAKGHLIEGMLTVSAPTVELEGKVPWAVAMFKGKIEKIVTARAEELLR